MGSAWLGRGKLRTKAVVLAGVLVVGLLVWKRDDLRATVLLWSARHGDAPTTATLDQLVRLSDSPSATLQRLWETGRILQRNYVVDHLLTHARREPKLWRALRTTVLEEALPSRDVEVQRAALTLMRRQKDRAAVKWARVMLRDPDPKVRRNWLRYLERWGSERLTPLVVRCLDDSNQAVVARAAAVLRKWTGENFGDGEDASDGPAIGRWKEWWRKHQSDYALPEERLANTRPAWGVPAPGFQLTDLRGRSFRLADFRGKVVVLNFWATWCPPCVEEIPELIALQKRRAEALELIGISLDGAHAHGAPERTGEPVERVRTFAERHEINYRVAVDPDGRVAAAYGGTGLPTTVWIDRSGVVRRRYVGPRSVRTMQRFYEEIQSLERDPST